MTVYTIDTSVHLNALNENEPESEDSQAFLARVERERLEMVCPTLLVTEMAAALSRAFDDYEKGMTFALAVRDLPNLTLVPLDEPLAVAAAELAARHRLRGADAVYAAVAGRHRAILVTNDRQQLERLKGLLPVVRPAQALAE
jgi:predicted nucleic acid-binding protein